MTMQSIRAIQTLNKQELEARIFNPEASWHVDYRDTAFVSFGGLPFNMSEGDVITIFSQFGEPVWVKLARDKETGKSRGFGWLRYEDQRSCDLAVDNLAGADIGGRVIRVDHARYKFKDDDEMDEGKCGWEDIRRREAAEKGEDLEMEDVVSEEEAAPRPRIKEEIELARLLEEHDEDDPMKAFLVEDKKKEVEMAIQKMEKKDRKRKHRHHHRHQHHRSHRSRRDESDGGDDRVRNREERHKSRRDRDESPVDSGRRRDGTPEARDRHRGGDSDRDVRRRDDDRDSDRRRDGDHISGRDKSEYDRDRRRERRRERESDDHNRDYNRDHKGQRRSRSRSPRSHRDR